MARRVAIPACAALDETLTAPTRFGAGQVGGDCVLAQLLGTLYSHTLPGIARSSAAPAESAINPPPVIGEFCWPAASITRPTNDAPTPRSCGWEGSLISKIPTPLFTAPINSPAYMRWPIITGRVRTSYWLEVPPKSCGPNVVNVYGRAADEPPTSAGNGGMHRGPFGATFLSIMSGEPSGALVVEGRPVLSRQPNVFFEFRESEYI